MKITERQIQILLMDTLLGRRHVSVVPNSKYLSLGEADLLSVTPSGLIHEFEIKCTLADYKAEFKRRREQSYRKSYKHSSLKWAHSGSLPSAKTPNYYWFVTYEFDIDPPDYAGWMLVTDKLYGFKLTEKKNAPRLHSKKWGPEKTAKTARLLSFKLLNEYKKEKSNG